MCKRYTADAEDIHCYPALFFLWNGHSNYYAPAHRYFLFHGSLLGQHLCFLPQSSVWSLHWILGKNGFRLLQKQHSFQLSYPSAPPQDPRIPVRQYIKDPGHPASPGNEDPPDWTLRRSYPALRPWALSPFLRLPPAPACPVHQEYPYLLQCILQGSVPFLPVWPHVHF